MKKLLIISALLLISVSSFAQTIRRNKVTANQELTATDKFFWQGDEISKDDLVYAEWDASQIRFQHINGAWTDWIPFTLSGGGEANTASSQGSGESVFFTKNGVDLQFNAIKSENNILTVALDGVTHDIELTIDETNINHNSLANYLIAEHRRINDSGSATTDLWSADKITTELVNYEPVISGKANGFLKWSTDHWVWDLTSYSLATHDHSYSLSDLSDIVSATNSNRFALMGNGTTGFESRALVMADISDLGGFESEITGKTNGFLKWSTDHWVWDLSSYSLAGHSHSIKASDLDATNGLTDGYVAKYDSGSGGFTWVELAAGGSGEINTVSSQGSGTSLFYQKVGSDLQFNAFKSENSLLSIALDATTHDIEFTLYESLIDHDNLTNFSIGEHRIINDGGTSTTDLWSADRIIGELNVKAPNTMTTAGDMLYYYSGAYQRRAIGSDGQILTVTSGLPTWEDAPSPGGSGDVVGPASSTDNALMTFDGTTGKLIQMPIGTPTYTSTGLHMPSGHKVDLGSLAELYETGSNLRIRNTSASQEVELYIGTAEVGHFDATGLDVTGKIDISAISAPDDSGDGRLYHNSADNKLYWKFGATAYDLTDSGSAGGVTSVSSSTTNQLTVANGTTTPALSIVTGTLSNGSSKLVTANTVYDWVIAQGYSTGSGGSPGGSTGQVQYNSGSAFAGAPGFTITGSGYEFNNNGGDIYIYDQGYITWDDGATILDCYFNPSTNELYFDDNNGSNFFQIGQGYLQFPDNKTFRWGNGIDITMKYDVTDDGLEFSESGGDILMTVNDQVNAVEIHDDVEMWFGDAYDIGMRWNNASSYLELINSASTNIAKIYNDGGVEFDNEVVSNTYLFATNRVEGNQLVMYGGSTPSNITDKGQLYYDGTTLKFINGSGDTYNIQMGLPSSPSPSPKPEISHTQEDSYKGISTQTRQIEYSPDKKKYRLTTFSYHDGNLVFIEPDVWKKCGLLKRLLIK